MARETSWTGVGLIIAGVAFLANSLGFLDLDDLFRFWPVLLIAIGLRIVLANRRTASEPPPPPPQ